MQAVWLCEQEAVASLLVGTLSFQRAPQTPSLQETLLSPLVPHLVKVGSPEASR